MPQRPLTSDMDTPAARLERVLIGVSVPLLFLTALAIAEGQIEILGCSEGGCMNQSLIIPIVAILCIATLVVMRMTRDRSFGNAPLDRWFSREPEEIMRDRLEQERFEATDEGLGGKWAELERKGLEQRYGEEEQVAKPSPLS